MAGDWEQIMGRDGVKIIADLYFRQKLGVREIARAVDRDPSTVSRTVGRCRKKLTQHINRVLPSRIKKEYILDHFVNRRTIGQVAEKQ